MCWCKCVGVGIVLGYNVFEDDACTVLSRASAHPCVSAHPPVLISLLSGRLLRVSAHLVFIPVLHNTMQYTNCPCSG